MTEDEALRPAGPAGGRTFPKNTARDPEPAALKPGRSVAGEMRAERAALAILDEIAREAADPAAERPRRPAAEPAFILHARPWSESSLVADALTLHHGRVFLIAKGAKRPGSNLRGLLTPFSPLKLTWTGRREAKILTRAEWMGVLPPLAGEALLSGFYVNELVLRLTRREDPHTGLFALYVRALEDLTGAEAVERQRALRRFEAGLLRLCGWEVRVSEGAGAARFMLRTTGDLAGVAQGAVLPPGVRTWPREEVEDVLAGRLEGPQALRAAREIYREAIELRLERPLCTRRVLARLKHL